MRYARKIRLRSIYCYRIPEAPRSKCEEALPRQPAAAIAGRAFCHRHGRTQGLYDESELKHLDFSPLLTGVIAAEVFIIGFILSGTSADFKEAERLPGELAASLETIADECLIMDAELDLPEARKCLSVCWQRSARPSASG
ncbi:MAG TPA: hypothetical protein VFC01_19180 [Mycobacterium sp.]|nr:hypothetical protein [Mycobacterium sp.]